MLVNDMIHGLYPEAIVVGEDVRHIHFGFVMIRTSLPFSYLDSLQVSGMPAFCIPVQDGGVGFDYRLHMAAADKWIELLKYVLMKSWH